MGKSVEDDFCVSCRVKSHFFLLELPAQLAKVIQFPIVDEGETPIPGKHRLMGAVGEVQNREATEREYAMSPVAPEAFIIRAATCHQADQPRDLILLNRATSVRKSELT